MKASLADGAPIVIRPIRPDDKPRLAEGLAHLSPQSVQRRFLGPKPRLTEAELRYLTEVDGRDHVAFVATMPDDPDHLLAVARFVRLREDPETAEAAIVVGDPYQRRGLGRILALHLADAARRRGIRRFTATYQADNVPAQRLMATIAARLALGPASGPTREAVLDLAA